MESELDKLLKENAALKKELAAAHEGLEEMMQDAASTAVEEFKAKIGQDCPTCHEPIYNVRGAIADMEKLTRKNADLIEALEEALSDLESWGSYVSDYFKEKHGFAEDLQAIRVILGK